MSMTPIEELLWRAKPVDEISHELINAARAELTQLRGDLATALHNLDTVRECKDWWQKNAEAIAKERGELFRAGEELRIVVQANFDCPEIAAWNAAAQPIRDMLANNSMPASETPTLEPATRGRVAQAKRFALMNFDKWNDVTGFVKPHTGYGAGLAAKRDPLLGHRPSRRVSLLDPERSRPQHFRQGRLTGTV